MIKIGKYEVFEGCAMGNYMTRLENNGVWLREHGDGRAHDDEGNTWLGVTYGIGDPEWDAEDQQWAWAEYQVVGWCREGDGAWSEINSLAQEHFNAIPYAAPEEAFAEDGAA